MHAYSTQELRSELRPEGWLDKRYELKAQRQVSSAGGQGEGPQRPAVQRPPAIGPAPVAPAASTVSAVQERLPARAPTQSRSAPTDPGQVALNPETIQRLHNTLRALPRPLLDSLTRAFRKRFQVPEEAVTIADRINQKCHHDWIEAFLVSHSEVGSAEKHREVRSAEQQHGSIG